MKLNGASPPVDRNSGQRLAQNTVAAQKARGLELDRPGAQLEPVNIKRTRFGKLVDSLRCFACAQKSRTSQLSTFQDSVVSARKTTADGWNLNFRDESGQAKFADHLAKLQSHFPILDSISLSEQEHSAHFPFTKYELTSLFIEYGPSVQIRHSSEQVWRDGKRRKSAFYDGPMGVIVNRLSASASEIFAGAIQDYGRGLIIGTQSFGKGTVQTLKPLAEGQLKITESKFYRISGDSTQHRGIEPDVTLPVMYNPEELGESTLDYALPWDQINAIRHPLYGDLSSVIPELIEASQSRQMSDPKMLLLQEQIALAGAESDIETISLNLEQRLADRDRKRALWLALENKQRALEGEEPLAQWTEDDDEDTPPEPAQDAEPINPSKDVLLAESIDVMADALTVDRRIEPAKQVGFR